MLFPIGIQDFKDNRSNGFVYVDKTRFIYKMVTEGKYYFLGRPRRFGKSLLLSTIQTYFEGRREYFKGLDIETLETRWDAFPILYIDLNSNEYVSETSLHDKLCATIGSWEDIYGHSARETSPALRFEGIIERAAEQTGKQVVVLVDEYDKPLVEAINNSELQDVYRTQLKAFYSVLKSQSRNIRFAFLTGVTKFSKISIFSDLNFLDDISLDSQYADICGITEDELRRYFGDEIRQFAQAKNISTDNLAERLRSNYDGYHFYPDSPGVYNPFSLLNALKKRDLKYYWFESGTPTVLVAVMQKSEYNLSHIEHETIASTNITEIPAAENNPIPLLYQSGYLTIMSYDEEFKTYQLGFPNKEVSEGFINFLLPFYTPINASRQASTLISFIDNVRHGRAKAFLTDLQTLFEDIDYRVAGKAEVYFQNATYLIFKLMSFHVEVEHCTSHGRIDILVKTPEYIYVIECKIDKPATEALAQINEKAYFAPFANDARRLFKIGISFSSHTRGIAEFIIDDLEQ